MGEQTKTKPQSRKSGGLVSAMWKHRLWWMLPLGVLLLLLGAIYALEHLSKTDSEMYPTSSQIMIAPIPHSS